MATGLSELRGEEPIVDPLGRASPYFLRYLFDRGGFLTSQEQALATLQQTIANKVDKTRKISTPAGSGLAGGGDLSADRTLSLSASIGLLTDVDTTTTPPADTQALVWSAANSKWKPGTVSGGGGLWWFSPPLASAFTVGSGDTTMPTLTDDANVGMILSTTEPNVAADRYRYATKALPASGNWTATCRLTFDGAGANYIGCGLSALESSTSKIASVLNFTSTNNRFIDVRRGTTTAFGADMATLPNPSRTCWYRIVYNSTANTYSFYASESGKNWYILILNVASATLFTTRADRIGICIFNSNTSSANPVAVACDNWTQTW